VLRRNWLAIVLCLVALAGSLGFSARRAGQRDHYDLAAVQDPALPALLLERGYVANELTVAPGIELRGMVRAPETADARFVLCFPGNTEPQLSSSLPMLEHIRAGRGFGIGAWAYRGYDGSGGVPSPAATEHDARAQLHYVRERLGVTPDRIVLLGYSLGSGIALRLAAELSRAGQPPAAVVLLSPFWSLEIGPAHPLEFFLPSEYYRVGDVVADVRSNVLVVAGREDDALPVAPHARTLVRALGERAEYWELPRRGHVDYLEDSSLLARIGNFALQ
jgi:pimeloyl-ACP methyl ester carboxylesterase